MKLILLLLSILSVNSLYAQQDIKKTIKSYCLQNNINIDCPHLNEAGVISHAINIVFHDTITIEGNKYMLAISEVENGSMQFHTFGCVNYFFLKKNQNQWTVIAEIIGEGPMPILEEVHYEFVQLGKDKTVLQHINQSLGNQHFEKNVSFTKIDLGTITPILNLNLEYNNSEWKLPELPEMDCNAQKMTQTFSIIASNKEWFDIEVTENEFEFSAGCEEESLTKSQKFTYQFNGTKYEKIK